MKRRVRYLEGRQRSRTHNLKRLHKIGAAARVESSSDADSLGVDAPKQGRKKSKGSGKDENMDGEIDTGNEFVFQDQQGNVVELDDLLS